MPLCTRLTTPFFPFVVKLTSHLSGIWPEGLIAGSKRVNNNAALFVGSVLQSLPEIEPKVLRRSCGGNFGGKGALELGEGFARESLGREYRHRLGSRIENRLERNDWLFFLSQVNA